MSEQPPDYSLKNAPGQREAAKPALYLVRYFQIREADYMKPPLADWLREIVRTMNGSFSVASGERSQRPFMSAPRSVCEPTRMVFFSEGAAEKEKSALAN